MYRERDNCGGLTVIMMNIVPLTLPQLLLDEDMTDKRSVNISLVTSFFFVDSTLKSFTKHFAKKGHTKSILQAPLQF